MIQLNVSYLNEIPEKGEMIFRQINEINIFKMRRQAYYLPNLSSLIARTRHQAHHHHRIKQATSQYHLPSSPSDPNQTKTDASPFQKQQRRQQQRENARMGRAIESNVSTIIPAAKQQEAYSSLKERIRKFTTEGSCIKYKLQKSLEKLQKQRQNQQQFWSQRVKHLQDNIKQTDHPIITQHSPNVGKINEHNDVFYQDCSSLHFSTIQRKITLNHPRSLTPQIFHGGRAKTESIRGDCQSSVSTLAIQARSSVGLEEKKDGKRYAEMMTSSIRDIILSKASRTLNPETLKKGKQQKSLADIQIIEIVPIG